MREMTTTKAWEMGDDYHIAINALQRNLSNRTTCNTVL